MHPSRSNSPLTLFDLLGAVWRYKLRFLVVAAVVFVMGCGLILLFPTLYESEAKLFVRLGRGSASLDPATVGQTISIQDSREAEMNSIVDLLESRGLAERVVTSIGVDRILKKHALAERTIEDLMDTAEETLIENVPAFEAMPSSEGALTSDEVQANREFDRAVRELQHHLEIDSPKKSTTISVSYRARTPELAHDVVAQLVDHYLEMHIHAHQSRGALDFFDRQFQNQERIVVAAENSLRDRKNASGVVTVEGKQRSLQSEITQVKSLQLETRADLQAAKAKVAELEQDMNELPRELMAEKTLGIAQGATDAMRDRLYELEIQEKDLSSKYVASHPELVKVRQQLQDARAIVGDQPQDREQSVVRLNPIRIDIENQKLLAEAEVASFEAKVTALESLENDLMQRLKSTNDLELESFDLQRRIDIARENHLNYAQKLEESRINAALDQQVLSNVSLVGEPTIRYKHVSPRRGLLAVLVALFAGLCGTAAAVAKDQKKRNAHLALAAPEHTSGFAYAPRSATEPVSVRTNSNEMLTTNDHRSSGVSEIDVEPAPSAPPSSPDNTNDFDDAEDSDDTVPKSGVKKAK